MLSCSIWVWAPSFWMGGGPESCVYGADVAVRPFTAHRTHDRRSQWVIKRWLKEIGWQSVVRCTLLCKYFIGRNRGWVLQVFFCIEVDAKVPWTLGRQLLQTDITLEQQRRGPHTPVVSVNSSMNRSNQSFYPSRSAPYCPQRREILWCLRRRRITDVTTLWEPKARFSHVHWVTRNNGKYRGCNARVLLLDCRLVCQGTPTSTSITH